MMQCKKVTVILLLFVVSTTSGFWIDFRHPGGLSCDAVIKTTVSILLDSYDDADAEEPKKFDFYRRLLRYVSDELLWSAVCTDIEMYSPLTSQFVRLNERNVRGFFNNEFEQYSAMEDDDVANLIDDLPRERDSETRVLFYLDAKTSDSDGRKKSMRELKSLQKSGYDIITMCLISEANQACQKYDWLPKHHVIPYLDLESGFDYNFKKVVTDVIKNPAFDRLNLFTGLKSDCQTTPSYKKVDVYVWASQETSVVSLLLLDFLDRKLSKAQVYGVTFSNRPGKEWYLSKLYSDRVYYPTSEEVLKAIDDKNNTAIHIDIKDTVQQNATASLPRVQRVVVDEKTQGSPKMKNDGVIYMVEEDLDNETFYRMLIGRMNKLLCGTNEIE